MKVCSIYCAVAAAAVQTGASRHCVTRSVHVKRDYEHAMKSLNVIKQNYSATPDRQYISSAQMTCTDSPDLTTQRPATPTVLCHPQQTHSHEATHTDTHTRNQNVPLSTDYLPAVESVSVRHSQRPVRLRSTEKRREFGKYEHGRQSF